MPTSQAACTGEPNIQLVVEGLPDILARSVNPFIGEPAMPVKRLVQRQ